MRILVVCSFLAIAMAKSASGPQVLTKNGYVQGKDEPGLNAPCEAFYGIPFAKPPIGSLRFQNPQPIDDWAEVYDATFPRSVCAQINFLIPGSVPEGDEDCLYLNIFRPKGVKKQLPVMVYIHGGGYFSGSTDITIYGPEYLMDTRDVVLVTVQYRLSLFGFLSSGDENCSGNFGLKDQNMALRWLKKNIAEFGGDANDITLVGESAGAASVHLQMLSKQSDELFQKAIVMSGTALGVWTYDHKPEITFRQFAEYAGIEGASTRSVGHLLSEIRELSAYPLLKFGMKFDRLADIQPIFKPAAEPRSVDAFLVEDPATTLEKGDYRKIPVLFGYTDLEGGVFSKLVLNDTYKNNVNANMDSVLAKTFGKPASEIIKLRNFYLNGASKITDDNSIQFLRIIGDGYFISPLYKTIEHYVKNDVNHKVFLYKFNFTSTFSMSFLFSGVPKIIGVSHADDLLYLFRAKGLGLTYAEGTEELKMSQAIVNTFVKFIKTSGTDTKRCMLEDLQSSSCDYTLFKRDNELFKLSTSNVIDKNMLALWDSLKIAVL